jgi:hypothetical protein
MTLRRNPMISRIILCLAMAIFAINNLLADPVKPKDPQTSEICLEKNKSKEVKELCKKWEKENAKKN